MQPEGTPEVPQNNSQTQPGVVLPQAPQQTPPQVPAAPAPVPVMSQVPATMPKKSHKKLIIGLIVAAIVVLGLISAVIVYLVFFGDAAKARAASNNFMNNITTANTEGAYALISHTGNKDSDINFLTGAGTDTMGDYKLSSYKIVAESGKKTTGYFLYGLTNNTNKYARVTVEKVDGKWIVTGYVYGKGALALVPAAKSETTTAAPAEKTTATQPAASTVCLVDADVAPLTGGTAYGTDFTSEGYRNYIVDTYFFNADSTDYAYPDQAKAGLDKVGSFYKTNSSKSFTIYLQGMARDASPTSAGIKLANQRAEKIKSELVARGAAADRFTIATPKSSATYSDGTERNVDLTIRVKIPCS